MKSGRLLQSARLPRQETFLCILLVLVWATELLIVQELTMLLPHRRC